ncbi:MAG: FAD-dependent monooxygenase [Hyphomicrobium sp.]|nr:FAD-dependent monooxygenase [Hyphomicrobium sp.]
MSSEAIDAGNANLSARPSARDEGVETFDVVISGASGSGLALALALSRGGGGELRIAVLDKSTGTGPSVDLRAYALSAASERMLAELGVWTSVAAEAQPVGTIEITDSSLDAGIRPVVLTYENVTSDGRAASTIVPSSSLLSSLRWQALAAQGVTLLPGTEATEIDRADGGAQLLTSSGRRYRAGLFVAAEGRASRLRDGAGIKLISWRYPQIGIVTIVAHERPHEGKAVQHFLPGGPFAILPMTGQRSCITWSEDETEARRILALDDAEFLAEVDKRFGGRLGRVSLAAPGPQGRQSWPLGFHLARAYVADRLALIGDTAHGVHPIAGQGLNLGFRDAAALAEVVIDASRLGLDIGSATVLERYERWRRFDSALSAAAFDGLNRLFSNDGTIVRAVRDVGLGIVDRMPELKSMLVTEAAGLSGELPRIMRGERI